ncbi:hypothetical protein MSIMFB_01238 [Mycobacterium simulans]|uniref:Uncharacterized protein n=1 Tax=Mycobacterium simulans TaxID=627089 RepID=A0A7Z7IJL7_9MYCO|nr:hypothetical protein MSIMFB_01238 [Mycobacterium simulans]
MGKRSLLEVVSTTIGLYYSFLRHCYPSDGRIACRQIGVTEGGDHMSHEILFSEHEAAYVAALAFSTDSSIE